MQKNAAGGCLLKLGLKKPDLEAENPNMTEKQTISTQFQVRYEKDLKFIHNLILRYKKNYSEL